MPTYLITGANRGLGLEFVRQLTSKDTSSCSAGNIIIAAVRSSAGELDDLRNLAEHNKNNSQMHIVECDTGSNDSISALGAKLPQILQGGKVDYVLNNAGINTQPCQTALTITRADLHEHIDVNVLGPIELTKLVSPHLERGSVVMNMTSGLGSFGKGLISCTTYAISKAALNMYTVHAAKELRDRGICVICMDPGWVKTRMGGQGALLEAKESVQGMLAVVHRLGAAEGRSMEGSAKFYHYDGSEVAW